MTNLFGFQISDLRSAPHRRGFLHSLEEKGYLRSSNTQANNHTDSTGPLLQGRKAMKSAKVKVRELFSEIFEDEETDQSAERRKL